MIDAQLRYRPHNFHGNPGNPKGKDRYGTEDPVLTITVEGWSDVVRLLHIFSRSQVEFCDLSARMLNRVKRRYGTERARGLWSHFTGGLPCPY